VPPLSQGNSLDHLITNQVLGKAEDTAAQCMNDVTLARMGHVHYYLDEPLRMEVDNNIMIPSANLRRVLDLATGVIGVGPISMTGIDASDIWCCLTPSSWFRASMALLASIVRGCVHSPNIHTKGDFPFEPCLDRVQYMAGIDVPSTQTNALLLLACQLLNELGCTSCTADFTAAEAAQLHNARFATFKAYVEAHTYQQCTVMGNQVMHLALIELVCTVAREHTHEELVEIVREDIRSCVRGCYPLELRELDLQEHRNIEAEHAA
jgi:hypothetical protein